MDKQSTGQSTKKTFKIKPTNLPSHIFWISTCMQTLLNISFQEDGWLIKRTSAKIICKVISHKLRCHTTNTHRLDEPAHPRRDLRIKYFFFLSFLFFMALRGTQLSINAMDKEYSVSFRRSIGMNFTFSVWPLFS